MISTDGIGTANRAPHERVYASCSAISSRRFQGRIRMTSGRESRRGDLGGRIGMWVPGRVASVLVRVSVDDVVDQVTPDAAVVEQSVRLPGGAVAGDGRPFRFSSMRNREQVLFCRSRPASRTRRYPSGRSSPVDRSRELGSPRPQVWIVVDPCRAPPRAGATRREWGAPRRRQT